MKAMKLPVVHKKEIETRDKTGTIHLRKDLISMKQAIISILS
jgi:hypothetical protein